MSALNWYQALALWKAAVFMEGNYKRFQAGNSDDEYLRPVRRGRARARREGARDRAAREGPAASTSAASSPPTSSTRSATSAWTRGSTRTRSSGCFRERPAGARAACAASRRGDLTEDEFGERFGELLELIRSDRAGLVDRMFGHILPGRARWSRRCAGRAAAGHPTGLISNSMGAGRYDRSTFPELFDGVVISGDEGMHKPRAGDLRAGRRARGPRRPPTACSWTTCARTARAPRRWG